MSIKTSDNSKQNDQISKLKIASQVKSSFNRETDFDETANMSLTSELKASNADEFKYDATPGYCANGGVYANGCALPDSI